jgi:hypothetical protein
MQGGTENQILTGRKFSDWGELFQSIFRLGSVNLKKGVIE